MANYDPQNFESVLLYMRQEFGTDIFRESGKMYAIICDLSPGLKAYGNVMRQLSERGALSELDAARNDDLRRNRALMKARDVLENELLLSEERAEYFEGLLIRLYGIAPPQPVTPPPTQKQPKPLNSQPAPIPQAQPTPPSPGKIIQSGYCGGNVYYTLDDNGLMTISGHGPMQNFNILRICDNTPWWNKREKVSYVEIQDGVTSIGDEAFIYFTGLTGVTIPQSVTRIGAKAFVLCAGLTNVMLPSSLIYIGRYAFSDCGGLTSVIIPNSVTEIENGAFYGCAKLEKVSVSVKTIINDAFPRSVRVTHRWVT